MNSPKLIYLFCFAFFAFASCQDNNKQNEADETEVIETEESEIIEEDGMENTVSDEIGDEEELSTFSMGMTRADLSDDFDDGEGPFTIFAPSNAAYDGLSEAERDQIENSEDVEQAASNIHYLVVERELPLSQLRASINDVGGTMELITMQGEKLIASLEGDKVVLKDGLGNAATIIEPDRDASNGVVHVIDGILHPQDIDRNDALQDEDDLDNEL